MKRNYLLRAVSGAACVLSAWSFCIAGDLNRPATIVSPPNDGFEQALSCWRSLVKVDLSAARHANLARPAIDRLLATAEGRTLIGDLCSLFRDAETGRLQSTIEISLVDHLPQTREDNDGIFDPATPGADCYHVFARTEYLDAATEPTRFVFGEYPGNPNCSVVFFYQEAPSAMAQTLYHELLHVWFVNAFAHERRRYPTGHGLVSRCEFEEEFFARLSAHAFELAELEGREPKPRRQVQAPH